MTLRNCFTKQERRTKFSYRDFIKSSLWSIQKEDWYSRHRKICARCKGIKLISLHHKRYQKNGRYLGLSDNSFVALCKSCHFIYHKIYGVKENMQKTSNFFVKSGSASNENKY